MILIIDHYDGCANNIYQIVGQVEPDVKIMHHDQLTLSQVRKMEPSHIILSGGSGEPGRMEASKELLRGVAGQIPTLGICLGCRIICASYGGKLAQMDQIEQGKRKLVQTEVQGDPLFLGVPGQFYAGFYCSERIVEESIADIFSVTARCGGDVVGIAHRHLPVFGLQFHPESFLSEYGKEILFNFLAISI